MNNDNEKIKSRAIVKYSLPKPAKFLKLQCNTDLNLPPSNWLSSSAGSYGFQHVLYQHKDFSSFRMAHMFPDCVGMVDVVSDAENIKNLLKIPYNKGQISMMVHRVENTLLLDNFDIYKHLLRTAESDWEWLRKFFYETVESDILDEGRVLYLKNKSRKALRHKYLVSKFLYHSLLMQSEDVVAIEMNDKRIEGPLLPEPSPKEEVPDAGFDHQYSRNVVWTFEDIEMLIGTDMPIFGGGTHPCISLRLRDMKKPISVLTGIDYWLDNLMSNVPEVVMCYHLNGIVQKYELIKTEDLPRMTDSKFSPKLIRDVAQSILSFLKSNATKAGHTYWLFKGKDEEVVKLYDLTSLCSSDNEQQNDDQNPFTVPVAMLLYRVARNMKHSRDQHQPGTIRMLLKNCIKLLNSEKYPEIVTSSHYMLADLYIPADTSPENPQFIEEIINRDDFDDDDDDIDLDGAMKVLSLNTSSSKREDSCYKLPPPISGGIEERCLQALIHIASGLNCLKYFPKEQSMPEDDIPMANSSEAIPMPYTKSSGAQSVKKKRGANRKKSESAPLASSSTSSNSQQNALLVKQCNEAQPLPTWQDTSSSSISWKEHLKNLLYEKAVLVYATLSEHHYTSKNYGNSLRCLGLLVRALQVMLKLRASLSNLKENCLLGRAGDCCVMIVQNWRDEANYRIQFHSQTDEDAKMCEQIEQDEQLYKINLNESNMKCVLLYDLRTIEQLLLKAVECYEAALNVAKNDDCILRRLANSLNEIGSYYLNRAKQCTDDVKDYCAKSEPYLKKSAEIFERVHDEANVALLYANIGHLHRLLAHANSPNERGELLSEEKVHYNKAFVNYNKALQVVGERKHAPAIWDAVKWELSTALYTMGTILHEHPSSTVNVLDAEKEVIETLQRALKACDLNEDNPKFPLYQFRAATIHYRLGSLYHNHIWSNTTSANRKNIITLAKLNYEKAARLYFISQDVINYLTAQMQRFALTEYLSETANSPHTKLKHLQQCLDILIEIREMIELIAEQKVDVPDEDVEQFDVKVKDLDNFKSCATLLLLVKQRLQYILRVLVKLCLSKPPINKDAGRLVDVYKLCYSLTFDLDKETVFYSFVGVLTRILNEIGSKL